MLSAAWTLLHSRHRGLPLSLYKRPPLHRPFLSLLSAIGPDSSIPSQTSRPYVTLPIAQTVLTSLRHFPALRIIISIPNYRTTVSTPLAFVLPIDRFGPMQSPKLATVGSRNAIVMKHVIARYLTVAQFATRCTTSSESPNPAELAAHPTPDSNLRCR
jgi:hypothetical protein